MSREIRQKKILELAHQKRGITIEEIRSALNVSAMTLHRDLRDLEGKNMIRRVRGGVMMVTEDASSMPREACAQCGGILPHHTRLTLISAQGSKIHACCCHCGFGIKRRENFSTALGVDFIYGTVVDLEKGYFLVKPEIKICCEPAILVFAEKENAQRMQRGFGGEVMSLKDVTEWLG